jgi:hypothetical protein
VASGTPFNPTSCHCSICRKTTGAPFVAWFSVRAGEFRFVAGEPAHYRSSLHGVRSFCRQCGTQLTFRFADRDEIDVTTSSLDEPERVPPNDNTRTSARLSWVVPDGRPDYREARDD